MLLIFVTTLQIAAAEDVSNVLLAHYPLATNTLDLLGKVSPLVAKPEFLTNGVLFVNGNYDGNGTHTHLLSTGLIPSLDYNTLTLSLDFYPLPGRMQPSRVLSAIERKLDLWTHDYYSKWFAPGDWDHRNIVTGGEAYRWLGFNRAGGFLNLTLNNQAFTHRFKDAPIKPNSWHRLICSLDMAGHLILTTFDGKQLEPIKLRSDFKLEIVGAESEAKDREFSFANYSNGSMFHGYAANLKIYGRSFTEAEVASLASAGGFPSWPLPEHSFPWPIAFAALLLVGLVVFIYRERSRRSRPSTLPQRV